MNDPTVGSEISTSAVIGAGTMGYGIALSNAINGLDVALYDVDEEMLIRARENIESGINTYVKEGYLNNKTANAVRERIEYESSLKSTVSTVDFVTEAVPEKMAVKKDVFSNLEKYSSEETILATNTSGLSITKIASNIKHPERLLGTHYFNPAHIVPVVEVIRGKRTADWAVKRVYELFEGMEYKTPVIVNREIPGFIANRIQLAMAYEAESLVERGIASPEDIDRAVKGSFGFRLPILGIFEKADQSGLDVHLEVEKYLMEDLDRGTAPHGFMKSLVENENYGLKTGRGIYDWGGKDPKNVIEDRDRRLLSQLEVYRNNSLFAGH